MGTIPVWGLKQHVPVAHTIRVAPPAFLASLTPSTLDASLTASGAVIVDLASGQTLYSRQSDQARPMASLTKLMTALIIVEQHRLDEVVTVPGHISSVGGTTAHLPAFEQFTVGDLLSALLINSANDAAVTLAEFHSGSEEAFVEEMNTRAKELGLKETTYKNATGLDESGQESSPRDLVWLAMFVLRYDAITERMSIPTARIAAISGKAITLVHTHQLLRTDDTAVFAGKTGTTDAAGQCLLTMFEHNGRRYIAVLLHSRDRYADMRSILRILGE